MAIHIRTRNELIDRLGENTSYRSIARAIQEGQVENLGAFNLPSGPGWIVKVTSAFNKVWYTKITPLPKSNYCGTVLIVGVPWEHWIGDKSDNKLYQGDNPLLYKELRDAKT